MWKKSVYDRSYSISIFGLSILQSVIIITQSIQFSNKHFVHHFHSVVDTEQNCLFVPAICQGCLFVLLFSTFVLVCHNKISMTFLAYEWHASNSNGMINFDVLRLIWNIFDLQRISFFSYPNIIIIIIDHDRSWDISPKCF